MRPDDHLTTPTVRILRIRLLGNLEVSDGEVSLAPPATRKARSLLAFLLVRAGRLHSRDALAGEFWGEVPQDRARQSLRTTLWRIRRGLGEGEGRAPLLVAEGEYVGFNADVALWTDVGEFEARLDESQEAGLTGEESAGARARALAVYRGPLLEECYDDWCLRERERLRERFVAALERQLAFEASRRNWKQAIDVGERLLQLDPLRESVHRELMKCLLLDGNRAAALRQYTRCAALLERELGVPPMRETTELYAEILAPEQPVRFSGIVSPAPQAADLGCAMEEAEMLLCHADATLGRLRTMVAELERARDELRERTSAESEAVTLR